MMLRFNIYIIERIKYMKLRFFPCLKKIAIAFFIIKFKLEFYIQKFKFQLGVIITETHFAQSWNVIEQFILIMQGSLKPIPPPQPSELQPPAIPPTASQAQNCLICHLPLEAPIAILICVHKYHTQCLVPWIVRCHKMGQEPRCASHPLEIGQQVIVDGETVSVDELVKSYAVSEPTEEQQSSDSGPLSYSRSRSRNDPDEQTLRRDLISQARGRGFCLLCLMPADDKTLVRKKCPTEGCRKIVPQHIECLAEAGDVNGPLYCIDCDQRMEDQEMGRRDRAWQRRRQNHRRRRVLHSQSDELPSQSELQEDLSDQLSEEQDQSEEEKAEQQELPRRRPPARSRRPARPRRQPIKRSSSQPKRRQMRQLSDSESDSDYNPSIN